jgi:hypothetical protein
MPIGRRRLDAKAEAIYEHQRAKAAESAAGLRRRWVARQGRC